MGVHISRLRIIWTALLLVCIGCKGPDRDYDRVRRDCGLQDEEHIPTSDDGVSSYFVIDRQCAEGLGTQVGMDWGDFEADPHDFEVATSTDEVVTAGLFTLISADMGTTGEPAMEEALPAWLATEFSVLGDDRVGEPLGSLWWAYLVGRVETVVQGDVGEGIAARYYEGRVTFADLDDFTLGGEEYTFLPVQISKLLVHETAHATVPDHVPCPEELGFEETDWCDESPEGAIGVEVSWLWSWLENNREELAPELLETVEGWLESRCETILDHDGFSPCMD